MYCIKCGNKIEGEMKFCPQCGAELPKISNVILEEIKNGGVQENTSQKSNNTVPVNSIQEDKTEPSWKKFVNIKTLLIIPILVVVIAIIGLFSGSDDSKVEKNTSINKKNIEGEEETITNDKELTGVGNVEVPVKKEDGTLVYNFEQVSDKIYVADCYEKNDLQCPYEAILNQKDFNLYDKIYLVEHRVDENRVTEDADGNRIQQVEGITNYVLDTMRIMCEYTTNDKMFTVRKYYNVCMTYWTKENPDDWYAITSDYIFEDEEFNYSNLNDTYWYIEGDDILNIGMENLIDWENGEVYLNYADLKVYIHFYDLANVPIESIWEDGTFRIPYEDHYEIGTVKVLYNGRKIEKKLYAGGINVDGFLQAGLTADEGLRVNIGIHTVDEDSYNDNRTTVKYVETIDANKYAGGTYPMVQISMSEYGNDSDIYSEKEEFSEDNIGGQDILYEVIADAPDGYVNVRTDTTTDSMVIYEARNGNLFSVTGEYGDWIEVALHPTGTNPFGYIHSSQVTRLSKTPNSNFIIEGSDSGYFGETFLEGFSAWDCRLARNEIYARHGKIFKDEALQTYFNSFSGIWYTPEYEDVPESMLNQWEKENIKTIVSYEEKMGYR